MKAPGEDLLIKLWETMIEKGVGSLLKPWQTRRIGRAQNDVRREELLMLAQTEVDAEKVRAGKMWIGPDGKPIPIGQDAPALPPGATVSPNDLPSIDVFVQGNARRESIRREINISKAILYAEDELSEDADMPPKNSVSDDWFYRWRDCAGDVSSEALQEIWGRVLAGEVKSPGRTSLRALDFLRNLSQDEATLIEKLFVFVVDDCIYAGDDALLQGADIKLSDLLAAQELGLISGIGIGVVKKWPSKSPDKFLLVLRSHGMALVATHSDASRQIKLKVYQLSSLGKQMLQLVKVQPNNHYLQGLGLEIKSQGFEVALGRIATDNEREIQLTELEPL